MFQRLFFCALTARACAALALAASFLAIALFLAINFFCALAARACAENRNVKITNKKETWAQIWNNDKWELKNKKLLISDIVDKGYNIIDYKKKVEDLNTIKKSKLNNFKRNTIVMTKKHINI